MATTTTKNNGRFVWYDCMTKDVAKAKDFYTQLLGWTVEQVDMGPTKYDMISSGPVFSGS